MLTSDHHSAATAATVERYFSEWCQAVYTPDTIYTVSYPVTPQSDQYMPESAVRNSVERMEVHDDL